MVKALLLATLVASAAAQDRYDVVVVSGSSGGYGAAIGAARSGAQVVLLEDTPVLGGMLSNGICNIDSYSYESQSGVFDEFRRKVIEYYRQTRPGDPFFAERPRAVRHLDGRSFPAHEAWMGGRWEPHVADRIFKEIASTLPNLRIMYNLWPVAVIRQGSRVTGVETEDAGGTRRKWMASVVIDGTHEGDISAWAGAPYRIGREARSALEPHAGRVYYYNGTGEFLPGTTGQQDSAIPSSGLRLTIQDYGDNAGDAHIMKSPPPGYNADAYRYAPQNLQTAAPNRKLEMNANPIGNELQQINWSWPEADRATRLQLLEKYRNHALGYLYYLQHVVGRRNLGLPRDEYTDNGGVPYRIYLREGRRIEGDAMLTEADINPYITANGFLDTKRDSIGVGHYPIDAKPVRPKTDFTRPDKGEGDFYLINASAPFSIPYGVMLPKNVEGLLTPVAVSATHVAFSSLRMDPTWMALGQAAGIAAAIAAREGIAPRQVPVGAIQWEAVKQKVRIAFYWDVPLEHPSFAAIQLCAVRSVFGGFRDRTFQPDRPISRAQLATAVVHLAGLWPSVSDQHFTDVGPDHGAFRDIETLFDRQLLGALGVRERWPNHGGYDGNRYSGFAKPDLNDRFLPEQPVRWPEFTALMEAALGRPVPSMTAPSDQAVTRAQAAEVFEQLSR